MRSAILILIVLAIIIVGGAFLIRQRRTQTIANLQTTETMQEVAREQGEAEKIIKVEEMEDALPKALPSANDSKEEVIITPETEVQITNGVKHIVPLDRILSGGPPKDGIPSIDDPRFVSVNDANNYLSDDGFGLSVTVGQTTRFYPFQILVWHEIVNDVVEGKPLAITYCPLCQTGLVFVRQLNNQTVEFGTSGKLYNSNLVMYDRLTDSYWDQQRGLAIVGKFTGKKLERYPSDVMRWSNWRHEYPDGQVLSNRTGFNRDYQYDPYGSYYTNRDIFFPVDNRDDRLHPKAIIYGVEINGRAKAYPKDELAKRPKVIDRVGGINLELTYNTNLGTLKIIRQDTKKEVVPTFGFWFSWVAVYPETALHKAL